MTEPAPVHLASIAPWISVPDGTAAVEFYTKALGAWPREALTDDAGRVMVAELAVGGATFWVQDDPDIASAADGGPIRLVLTTDDPDAVLDRAVAAGALLVNPVNEEHGWRVGRISDPYGTHWEIGRRLG
jgi:PhnB protein